MVFLLAVGACKKTCTGGCGSGSCVNGVCVCDSAWMGINCTMAVCQINHTGTILIVNHKNYNYGSPNDSNLHISANSNTLLKNVSAGSFSMYLISNETCPSVPCSIINDGIRS